MSPLPYKEFEKIMPEYPHLLSPLELKSITLPNRVVMGSMHLGLEEIAGGFERMAAFYAERARGGAGLMITGGVSPNRAGRPFEDGAVMVSQSDVDNHRLITEATHRAGGRILLQLLHFGRYAKHADLVAPSALRAPINRYVPRELTGDEIESTIEDFIHAAMLAQQAGYDGVEIMGSEGYLLNTFIARATNKRSDQWGGSLPNRCRLALDIIRGVRAATGVDFTISYRLSMLDLVADGSTLDETIWLAREVESAGACLINTGIGWHESRVPTIATGVPRAAFTGVTAKVTAEVGIPVAASNRINTPGVAEALIASGAADLVAMARPLLADPNWVNKAARGAPNEINTCIGCNQGCIDHTLTGEISTCLVNPRAGFETELVLEPVRSGGAKRIAVVGGGVAGISCALTAADRGHRVDLFEARGHLGGQFDLAQRIPGKEEFQETLRYFRTRLAANDKVTVHLGREVTAAELEAEEFDEIVIATGVVPREVPLDGSDSGKVVDYAQVLRNEVEVGDRVAIVGAGGIGFDVAHYVTEDELEHDDQSREFYFRRWGVDPTFHSPGGVVELEPLKADRSVTLLQRKTTKVGAGLGVTTGWIHRAEVAQRGVHTRAGVEYLGVDESGLHIRHDDTDEVIEADTVIICAGQSSRIDLKDDLDAAGLACHVIGGAALAAELDAKRAIRQGVELGAQL